MKLDIQKLTMCMVIVRRKTGKEKSGFNIQSVHYFQNMPVTAIAQKAILAIPSINAIHAK